MKKLTMKDLDKLTVDGLKAQILNMQNVHEEHIRALTNQHRNSMDKFNRCANAAITATNARKVQKVADKMRFEIEQRLSEIDLLGFRPECDHYGGY